MLSYYAIHPKQVLNIRKGFQIQNTFKILNEQKTYKIGEQSVIKVSFDLFCVNCYYSYY